MEQEQQGNRMLESLEQGYSEVDSLSIEENRSIGLEEVGNHQSKESERSINRTVATSQEILKLVDAQGYKCALTGWALEPATAVLDHVVPLSQGGANTIDNLQVVHSKANAAKGVMSQDDFIALCRAVVAHAST